MKTKSSYIGPKSSFQILVMSLQNPHLSTISEPIGSPCPNKMTTFPTYENQNNLYGPLIHISYSSDEPPKSTFLHPLGTERLTMSYYNDHILNILK